MKIDSGEFEKLNDGNWEDKSSKSLVFPNRTRSRALEVNQLFVQVDQTLFARQSLLKSNCQEERIQNVIIVYKHSKWKQEFGVLFADSRAI